MLRRDWHTYNLAQTTEASLFQGLLADLLDGTPEPEQTGPGRPRLPVRDVLHAAVLKQYTGKSSRINQGLVQQAHEAGHLSTAPHFNAVGRFLNDPDAEALLRDLVQRSATPFAGIETQIAIDSTAFRTTTLGAYAHRKHGIKQNTDWVKLHAATGVLTNVITDSVVTDRRSADVKELPGLVAGTRSAFRIDEVSADKAYSSRYNIDAIVHAGGVPYIPFKKHASSKAHGTMNWTRAYHFFQLFQEDFMQHYHKRSNVEATFSALKKRFGESVRSRTLRARCNEVQCRVVAWNICVLVRAMHEYGIPPDFRP